MSNFTVFYKGFMQYICLTKIYNMSNLEKHLISAKECKILAEDYVKNNYSEINTKRPDSKPDSKEYSMDLEVLQDYLQMIKEEMDKRGIKSKGVKVTLGKYPENSKDDRLKPEYLGYQTIFFSPVDLGGKENANRIANLDLEAKGNLDEISNLNFMNITPPY